MKRLKVRKVGLRSGRTVHKSGTTREKSNASADIVAFVFTTEILRSRKNPLPPTTHLNRTPAGHWGDSVRLPHLGFKHRHKHLPHIRKRHLPLVIRIKLMDHHPIRFPPHGELQFYILLPFLMPLLTNHTRLLIPFQYRVLIALPVSRLILLDLSLQCQSCELLRHNAIAVCIPYAPVSVLPESKNPLFGPRGLFAALGFQFYS